MPIINRSFNTGTEIPVLMVITNSLDFGNLHCYFFLTQIIQAVFGINAVMQEQELTAHVHKRHKTTWSCIAPTVGNTGLEILPETKIISEMGVLELYLTQRKKSILADFILDWEIFIKSLRDHTGMFKMWLLKSHLLDPVINDNDKSRFIDTYADDFHILFAQTGSMANVGIYFVTYTTNFIQTMKNINKVSFEKYTIISARPVRNGVEAFEMVKKTLVDKPPKKKPSTLMGRHFFMISPKQMQHINEILDTMNPMFNYSVNE